ncbi:MAG: amidohydrolase family protein [Desulfurococcaceae archaeon]
MKRGSPALIINLHHILYGEELEDLGRAHLVVEDGFIKEIGRGWVGDAHINGGVAVPLPVNAHIHLNDYRAPDHHFGLSLSDYAGRKGLKHSLIQLYKEPLMPSELLNLFLQYSYIVDYQEKYLLCRELAYELGKIHTNYIGLSRPVDWVNDDLEEILKHCSGLGISNPVVIPVFRSSEIARISRNRIVSSHISENRWMEETGGLHYLLSLGIKLKQVVHGVFLEDWEFKILADQGITLVSCPRSNIWFSGKLPDYHKALKYGVRVAIGTDNAGCFHPDIWEEAFILLYYSKIDPLTILKFILINGYYSIGLKPLVIKEGGLAYFMVIDLGIANERSGNIYLSLINRFKWSRINLIIKGKHVFSNATIVV